MLISYSIVQENRDEALDLVSFVDCTNDMHR